MAVALPIQNPAIPPTEIAARTTDDVPVSMLDIVDRPSSAGVYWMMARLPARAMRALHAAALAQGIQLSSTGRTRTFGQQKDLFTTRHEQVTKTVYDKLPSGADSKRLWPNAQAYGYWSIYWKLKPGMAAAAVPSRTAPHVQAVADDTAEIVGGKLVGLTTRTLTWLVATAPAYGFRWSLTSEPWHVQWVAGDAVPQAVRDYEASLSPTPPPTESVLPGPTPTPPTWTPQEDKLATARITVEGRNAQFYGTGTMMPDGSVHCLMVTWSGPGEQSFHQDHSAAADVVAQHYLPEVLKRDLVLVGDPATIQDSLHTWSAADFFRVAA